MKPFSRYGESQGRPKVLAQKILEPFGFMTSNLKLETRNVKLFYRSTEVRK